MLISKECLRHAGINYVCREQNCRTMSQYICILHSWITKNISYRIVIIFNKQNLTLSFIHKFSPEFLKRHVCIVFLELHAKWMICWLFCDLQNMVETMKNYIKSITCIYPSVASQTKSAWRLCFFKHSNFKEGYRFFSFRFNIHRKGCIQTFNQVFHNKIIKKNERMHLSK